MGTIGGGPGLGVRPPTIGIPLRSQDSSPDWPMTCRLLERTLGSIAQQSVACARVIIACHEIPPIAIPVGLEVEFVPVDFAPPKSPGERSLDAQAKRLVVGAHHRRHGGGRLFLLDADDLLDRDFIATTSRSPARVVVLATGYQINEARDRVTLLPRFWRRCGSCAVVDWRVEELPDSPLVEADSPYARFNKNRHYNWPAVFKAWGWPVTFMFRPVALYVVNHGQNISLDGRQPGWKWRAFNRYMPGVTPPAAFRARFGLAPLTPVLGGDAAYFPAPV